MDNKQIFEMADELKSAKEYKKDLEAQVKEVNARIEELDRALSDAMAESELEKFTRNGSTTTAQKHNITVSSISSHRIFRIANIRFIYQSVPTNICRHFISLKISPRRLF